MYIELHCHSYYSLLDGASSPAALLDRAAALGMPALALTDHDGLIGAVEFWRAARERGIRPIIGAEVTLAHGSHLTLLAETQAGYANLSRLIAVGQLAGTKGAPRADHRGRGAARRRAALPVGLPAGRGGAGGVGRRRSLRRCARRASWRRSSAATAAGSSCNATGCPTTTG